MNLRRTFVLLTLVCLSLAPFAHGASPNVVISQAYGGGGATTGSPAYINDYVELFNTSNAAVVVGGWSVQYGAATGQIGNSGTVFTFPAGTTIPAGKYLLVKTGTPGTLGANFTADFTTTNLNMAAGAGKVALVNSGTSLGCGATATPCTLPDARIVDLVAWGAASNGEGGTTVNNGSALNSTNGAVRKSNGCQDTDNNNADFIVATTGGGLVPRNSTHAGNSCGVTNNAPAINAPANPIATVFQDSAPFTVALTGNDDGGVYVWSATAGSGISSVNVTGGQGTANVTYTVALQSGFTGIATFTASLSDNVNPAATRAVNIQVNSNVPNNPPAINTPANPIATVMQDAAPFTVGLSGSDDNNVFNWSASAGTGVSTVSVSGGQGTASATFTVTLQSGFSGTATFTASLSDTVNVPVSRLVNITVTPAPPPNLDHLTISQVYGGGGNAGATYQRDYVELFNATNSTIDTAGWSIQYASATGSSWQVQPLGGPIAPGEYYLIALATGVNGAALPAANIDGEINMAAGAGKMALVSNGDPLDGVCPSLDPDLVDLVGYGTTATCREGASNAPGASNTTSLFRKNGGFTDTNVNGFDFVTGTPNPRRTAPIVEIGPAILFTDPRVNATSAPRDANLFVTFTESVEVGGAWFAINCATTGAHLHDDATVAGAGKEWIIVPNAPFINGEQCTMTIFKDFVHDTDLDDSAPNTDTLTANYTFTFTTSTGTLPAYSPDVHLTMGNPSGAVADTLQPNNYLMEKPEYTLSYNRDRGTPNWVSWHLADEWVGTLTRVDTFRADSAVPEDWYRVLSTDYQSTGFDRGHLVPNADRDKETSIPINQATFLMTNMMPQSPDNNQGPWADLENYLRTLVPANELYIVAGGSGTGGTGSNGYQNTIANGHVTVPSQTWKVALVLPKAGGDDTTRVTAGVRTIAVILPNVQGIRSVDWETYLTTVDAVEALSGYDFFANVGDAVENAIEAGVNGANPPGVDDSSVSTDEDTARTITLDAVSANGGPLTYTIVSGPQHGTLDGTGASQTYTPFPDFNGNDTFTFRVNDGTRNSNVGTVTITVLEVNDPPVASGDSKSTSEDTALSFAASDLTANDVAGPANELGQTKTVTSVTAGANTHGSVALSSGIVTYIPDANFNGNATFSYEVCDNGITNGLTTPLCATATVSVAVSAVNDAPSVSITSPPASIEGTPVSASLSVTDIDAGDSFTAAWTATKNGAPFASGSGNSFSFTPDDDGAYVVSVTVTDSGNSTGSDSETVAVSNAAPAIAAISGPSGALALGAPATIHLFYLDPGPADTHTASITWDDGSTSTVACAAGACHATRTYAAPGVYDVVVVVTDDDGGAATTTFSSIVVYDANGGFVTGGGFINNPAGGKGNFNFNPKYQKNAATPTGNTQFKTDAFDFKSTSHEWLAVAGNTAQFQGSGTINGAGNYGFTVTAIDGTTDTFHIRIWNKSNGATVYDNGSDQALAGGSIVVHPK